MDREHSGQPGRSPVFVAALPKAVPAEGDPPTIGSESLSTFSAAPARIVDTSTTRFKPEFAFALLIVAAIGLAVVPEVITHLNVKHSPDLPPGEDAADSKYPLAHLASYAGSAALLALSGIIVFTRGRTDRNVPGVLILLFALNLPYLTSPVSPGPADLVKLVFANAFILALWSTGAPISQLKWMPYTVTGIALYSLIGGVIMPDYFMYNLKSEKAIIPGWELAGPFGHANVLGVYCSIAFSLLPFIPERRWRIVCGCILLATTAASASRTGLIAALIVAVWWGICSLRSVVSVRLVGTGFVALTGTVMFVFPFLDWDPSAFSYRASVWVSALGTWAQSPIFGQGVNWFLTDAQSTVNTAVWAYVGTGHNLVVDTLVKSGLLGVAVLVPVLLGAVFSARALRFRTQQIACFGYLIVFFVIATTEAVWSLLPNLQLFPISGLIFSVLALALFGDRSAEAPS